MTGKTVEPADLRSVAPPAPGAEKADSVHVQSAKDGMSWIRPARWIVLVSGVAAEWAARYYGAPIWTRLVIIAAIIVVILMLTSALNTARLSEAERRQKTRSLAIAGTLFALVALFYAATIVRLGPNALNKQTNPRPAVTAPAAAPAAAPSAPCKPEGKC